MTRRFGIVTLMSLLRRSTRSHAPRAVCLIRLLVGAVFLSEGVQKFLYPADVGAGRFERIGLPWPELLAPAVGGVEIVCGLLVLLGLLTRLATLPLITIMCVAIATTKIPTLHESGFWKMAHAARTDFSMLLCSIFLLLVGAGSWSLDAWIDRRRHSNVTGRG